MEPFRPEQFERTSTTNARAEIEDEDVLLFLRAALDEGGRILIERSGNVYEIYEAGDRALHLRLVGPDAGL